MKSKLIQIIGIVLLVFSCNTIWAQSPQKMSYQAVIRNSSGELLANAYIGMKISILQGSVTGTEVFSETHETATSSNGLVSIEIGGGRPATGTFNSIDWASGTYFIKTETDPTGGSNYSISGTSQLLSVPYSIYAEKVKFQGRNTIYIRGRITNEEAQSIINEQLGPNTENIYILGTQKLTSLDLSAVSSLVNLEIRENLYLKNINIQNLTRIDNLLNISGNELLNNLNFSSMLFAGDINCNSNRNLATVEFPDLYKVMDNIHLIGNNISIINLASLNNAKSIIMLENNCNSIDISNLIKVDDISISGESLLAIDLRSLEEISDYNYGGYLTPNLASINLASLKFIYGNFNLENSKLTSVTFPSLLNTRSQINISGNNLLTSISFPKLMSYLSMKIAYNPILSTIQLPSFTQIGGIIII